MQIKNVNFFRILIDFILYLFDWLPVKVFETSAFREILSDAFIRVFNQPLVEITKSFLMRRKPHFCPYSTGV
jgi:hypothetical protein